MRLSQLRRDQAEKLGDTAWAIEGWSLERLAALAEIDPALIEDDERVIPEDEPLAEGWSPSLDHGETSREQRDRAELDEIHRKQCQYQMERADLGGFHRITAALASQQKWGRS